MSQRREARRLARAGHSVLPIGPDKRPSLQWHDLQCIPLSEAELEGLPLELFSAIAIIGGVNGVVALDFDAKHDRLATYEEWCARVERRQPGLSARPLTERSRSGGIHRWYRTPNPGRKHNPACLATGEALIEVKAAGAYCIACPSPRYRLEAGDLANLPELTVAEHQILLEEARALDRRVLPATVSARLRKVPGYLDDLTDPASAYQAQATVEDVAALVEEAGATCSVGLGGRIDVVRPGQTDRNRSCGNIEDRGHGPVFYNFSPNFYLFEPDKAYNAWSVYRIVRHHGDHRAARQALFLEGYGSEQTSLSGSYQPGRTVCVYSPGRIVVPMPYSPGVVVGGVR